MEKRYIAQTRKRTDPKVRKQKVEQQKVEQQKVQQQKVGSAPQRAPILWNFGVALLVAMLLLCSMTGCSKASEKLDEVVNSGVEKVQSVSESEYGSAQEIVDDYSAQMKKRAKTLGKELKAEAPARYQEDGTLAVLLKEKTGELADLFGDGSQEISNYVLYSGDSGESPTPYVDALYDAYDEATDLLMDDYQEALRSVR